MRLSELQALMRVRYSQPGLSRLVQRMEGDGLVERVGDARRPPRHHRAPDPIRAGPHAAARAVYDRALERHLGSFVGTADARAAHRLLRRVADARAGD